MRMDPPASLSSSMMHQAANPFQLLVESIRDYAITLLSDHCEILYASPGVQQIIGYSPAELRGRTGFHMIHPDDLNGSASLFQKAVATPGVPFVSQHRLRHLDGSYCWVEFTATNW